MEDLNSAIVCGDYRYDYTFQGDNSTKPSDPNIVGSSLSEEERKRLANELEEIERER